MFQCRVMTPPSAAVSLGVKTALLGGDEVLSMRNEVMG